jgi:hypothetical protein
MIKFNLDFSNATQVEVDAFYAIQGMQSAIAHLQTNNRKYNTILTVIEPGSQLVEVKVLIMEFMRKLEMEAGNPIPAGPFAHTFMHGLNPKQKTLVDAAFASFVSDDVLKEEGGNYLLTERGFEVLY